MSTDLSQDQIKSLQSDLVAATKKPIGCLLPKVFGSVVGIKLKLATFGKAAAFLLRAHSTW